MVVGEGVHLSWEGPWGSAQLQGYLEAEPWRENSGWMQVEPPCPTMGSASFREVEGVAELFLPRGDMERGSLAEPSCADTLVSDLQPPDRETIKSCC